MRYANYYILSDLLAALEVMSLEEAKAVAPLSSDDEAAMRVVIRAHIVPYFRTLANESQKRCKESLAYFLTTGNAPFDRLMAERQESPIGASSEPARFFGWVWSELFPAEDFQITLDGWKVENNPQKATLFLRT